MKNVVDTKKNRYLDITTKCIVVPTKHLSYSNPFWISRASSGDSLAGNSNRFLIQTAFSHLIHINNSEVNLIRILLTVVQLASQIGSR